MNMSESVGWKNFQHWIRTWCGGVCFLSKQAGYSFLIFRGKRGMFFYWAGLGGILAGYLNCWRPNLPQYAIRWLSNCMMICNWYHIVFFISRVKINCRYNLFSFYWYSLVSWNIPPADKLCAICISSLYGNLSEIP